MRRVHESMDIRVSYVQTVAVYVSCRSVSESTLQSRGLPCQQLLTRLLLLACQAYPHCPRSHS